MNERTAVLFLVLCVAALLGLIELEKVFEEDKIAKKDRKVAELKKQKEEQEKAEAASLLTARYLWNFLSGMTSKHKLQTIAA